MQLPRGRLPRPEVAVWCAEWAAGGEGRALSGAGGTHVAQVQELSLIGQAEEGRADDQVNLREGPYSGPGQGREASGLGCPALNPQLPSPAGWATEWPGGRAAP